MGAVLEMKLAAKLTLLVVLAGCGNDPISEEYARPVRNVFALLAGTDGTKLGDLDAAGQATLRAALEADRQPIISVANPGMKYTNLMAPYGQNGDVQTWASMQYETLSLREGMLVSSRGFGPDLMAAVGPTAARIASGGGETARRYVWLDGADARQVFEFGCTLHAAGSEVITVLGKSYSTRRVTEDCSGSSGSFSNDYWFDKGTNLRQSSQLITLGLPNLVLQRVID
jgi:hypothetical protein